MTIELDSIHGTSYIPFNENLSKNTLRKRQICKLKLNLISVCFPDFRKTFFDRSKSSAFPVLLRSRQVPYRNATKSVTSRKTSPKTSHF